MQFDRAFALTLAQRLQDLYSGALQPTVRIGGTDTQAWIGDLNGAALVLFPGTASGRDVLTDLRAAKTGWGKGRAHVGFVAAFRSAAAQLIDAIGRRPVFVAGHSLGGALAMLTADYLGPRVQACYTFGQPRVFNGPAARDFDRTLGERTFRIVNGCDPVPRIPWLLGTYRHCGTEVYLPRDGGIEIEPTLWLKARERAAELRDPAHGPTAKAFGLLNHHGIAAYIARLKQLA